MATSRPATMLLRRVVLRTQHWSSIQVVMSTVTSQDLLQPVAQVMTRLLLVDAAAPG